MKFLVYVLACLVACASTAPPLGPRHLFKSVQNAASLEDIQVEEPDSSQEEKISKAVEEAALFKKQAEGAHYQFESSVDDGIQDHAHHRAEKRDGLSVEGSYSYSDGFFHRTVHYVADDKGFRIVKEENEPIGDGPVVDINGKAFVKSSLGTEYTITVDDYKHKEIEEEEEAEE